MNLLRPIRRQQASAWLGRAAVLAGMVAGLGACLGVAHTHAEGVRHEATMVRALPAVRYEPPATIRHEPPVIRQEPDARPPALALTTTPRVPPVTRVTSDRKFSVQALDAVVETILFSPERQLAIVDGRVVGRGDGIWGATIVEITPNTVVLRDEGGQLVRLFGR